MIKTLKKVMKMKIYVSCTNKDRVFADEIIKELEENSQYNFTAYHKDILIGDDYKQTVSNSIRDSNIVIAFISKAYIESKYAVLELDWSLAYYYENKNPIILPVILDNVNIPYDISNIYCLVANKEKKQNIIEQLRDSINRINVTIEEANAVELNHRVVIDGSKYIEETKQRLEKSVNNNRNWAIVCYSLCFIFLIIGLIYSICKSNSFVAQINNTQQSIKFTIESLLVVSLFISIARFTLILGKSFMVESIRNNDRIHAIDFGDFYLKLFKNKFEWKELKEILQNWNIDKGSAFITQDEKDIEPSILSALVEYMKKQK